MRFVVSTIAFLSILGFGAASTAADSLYCGKVRARANGDAAMLLAPKLFVQGLRFPLSVDLGPATNHNFQLRVGLSLSPLDGYRGLKLMNLSDIDCQAFESRDNVAQALTDALDGPVAVAYRAQIDHLKNQQPEWRALLQQAQHRLNAHLITVMEFEEFFRRFGNLDHKLEQAQEFVDRYAARRVAGTKAGLRKLGTAYIDDQRKLERGLLGLRSLDDWNVRVVGGAIPMIHQPLGWFGWIEASYNFGGLVRESQDHKYLEIRHAEVEQASYELPSRLRVLEKEAQATREHARRELVLVEEHLRLLNRMRAILNATDASAVLHERDIMAVEHLLATTDQVYWSTLLKEVENLLGDVLGAYHHD